MIDLGGITLVVTGFPRSGTSMMMRMLRLAGIEILSDDDLNEESKTFDPNGVEELRDVDGDLHKNPKEWTFNKALKIVSPYYYAYPVNRPLKFIFMQRPIGEIIVSMLAKGDLWTIDIETAIANSRGYIEHIKAPVIFVQYHDVLKYPKSTALRVQEFLGVELNIDEMIKGADKQIRDKIPKNKAPNLLTLSDSIDTMFPNKDQDVVVWDLPGPRDLRDIK